MPMKVVVADTPCYDFLCSILRLHNNEHYTPEEEGNPDIIEWALNHYSRVPQCMRKKTEAFFNLETSFAFTLTDMIRDSGSMSVPMFIAYLRESPAEQLLSRFLYTGAGPGVDVSAELIAAMGNEQNAVFRFVQESLSYSPQEKWRIMEYLSEPEETKAHLIEVLEWHYNEVYQEDEAKTVAWLADINKDLRGRLSYDKELLNLLVPCDHQKAHEEITIALSYYFEKGTYLNVMDSIYIFGYRRIQEIQGEHSVEIGAKVFKALADQTRLQILKLLLQRPWYGHELALQLGLSNSTITHHLMILAMGGLVKAYRQENRVYYELNPQRARAKVLETLDSFFRN